MICDWADNVTTATCTDPSIGESPQGLWDTKVMPFVDLTVKGFLWYQVRKGPTKPLDSKEMPFVDLAVKGFLWYQV